eukprot:TRINITY_DN5364_c0_g1_i2.p1 TRINITY_DN5364_c0_g1~~TRINITY_DN5364_c0_g1_i2.p1  ORF type:complete len:421 (-),score=118.42 TRINITY_DN5364_c0_g1_i2:8-1270(-)
MDLSLIFALLLAVVVFLVIWNRNSSSPSKENLAPPTNKSSSSTSSSTNGNKQSTQQSSSASAKDKAALKKKERDIKKKEEKKKEYELDHPLWVHTYRGFREDITSFSFSPQGHMVASSEDKSVKLFPPLYFDERDNNLDLVQKSIISIAINRDHGICVDMTEKTVVVALDGGDFHLYDINFNEKPSKAATLLVECPKDQSLKHKKDVMDVSLAPNNKYFVSSTPDTFVKIWSKSGEHLAEVNSSQMINKMVKLSSDSKFMIIAAFTSEVRIWEIMTTKTGEFEQVKKVMNLPGHKVGINCACFSPDNKRVFTGGRDGIWRSFKIDVRYAAGADTVMDLQIETQKEFQFIEISPDGKKLATIHNGNILQIWDPNNGAKISEEMVISDVVPALTKVKKCVWYTDSKHFAIHHKRYVYLVKCP